MKKLFSIMLIALLMVSMVGCGSGDKQDEDADAQSETNVVAEESQDDGSATGSDSAAEDNQTDGGSDAEVPEGNDLKSAIAPLVGTYMLAESEGMDGEDTLYMSMSGELPGIPCILLDEYGHIMRAWYREEDESLEGSNTGWDIESIQGNKISLGDLEMTYEDNRITMETDKFKYVYEKSDIDLL